MPVEIKDSDGGLGSIIRPWGSVDEGELVEALKNHLTQENEKFRQYRYSLSDYTGATILDVSTSKVKKVAEYCRNSAKVNPEAVVAIVADQDVLFGLARMWEVLSQPNNWETRVFRNKADAESWIKKRVLEKYGIHDLAFC